MNRKNLPYTKDETLILQENYVQLGAARCMELLPGRHKQSILAKAARMNLRFDQGAVQQERTYVDDLIRQHYHDKGPRYVAILAGKRQPYIVRRAFLLGIGVSAQVRGDIHSAAAVKGWGKNKQKTTIASNMGKYLGKLSKIEKLAMYLPWGKYERDTHEVVL